MFWTGVATPHSWNQFVGRALPRQRQATSIDQEKNIKNYRFCFLPVMLPRKSEEEVVWMVPSVGLAPKINLSFQLISWGPSTLK